MAGVGTVFAAIALAAEVLVKVEFTNPTGSYKDRMALAVIEGSPVSGSVRQ